MGHLQTDRVFRAFMFPGSLLAPPRLSALRRCTSRPPTGQRQQPSAARWWATLHCCPFAGRNSCRSPAKVVDSAQHRVVSVEGLSAREPDPHAHPRRRRIPATLPAARPSEALCPHSLLRLPRPALSDTRPRPVSSGACCRPDAAERTVRGFNATTVVAVPALRGAHAHRRAPDPAAARPRSAPGSLLL
jgi:hypothetical protein